MLCNTLFYFLAFCSIALGSPVARYGYNRRAKSEGMRTVGYFGNWVCNLILSSISMFIGLQDIYARGFTVVDIDASQLSHVIYSFANVNTTTGEV